MTDRDSDPVDVECMRIGGEARWERWVRDFARPAQIPHPEKAVSLYIGGRGSGKTRAGAEWLCRMASMEVGAYGLIGPDYSHLISEILEPWIFSIIPAEFRHWRGSIHQLDLANGSRIKLYTAEKPGKVRGPNLMGKWIDEPAEMRFGMDAWTNSQLATRIERPGGLPPQTFVTGTPKRVPLMTHLFALAEDRAHAYHLSNGTMRENIANLSPDVVAELEAQYAGTNLGLQELEGIMVEDVEGALLTCEIIERHRADQPHTSPSVRAMSIDPGFSSNPTADEVGVVIGQRIGSGPDSFAEVIDDCSTRGTPGTWGERIVDKTVEHHIDVIVYESNMTGQWLKETLVEAFRKRAVKMPRLESVVSRNSKWARAEPIAALAEKGRYRMVGSFGKLESELTTWVPDSGMRSPNRLDAWAQLGRYLLIKNASAGSVGPSRTRTIGRIA